MKSRDTLLRLKRFQVEERRRRVAQIEAMIAEFSRMASDLDREIGGRGTAGAPTALPRIPRISPIRPMRARPGAVAII